MDDGPNRISDRLKSLIDCRTDKRGKFAQLEAATNITAESWKSFYYGRQRPNPDMIEAIATMWPDCAFWLATGIEDETHGHVDPTRVHDTVSPRTAATPYFHKLIELVRHKANKDQGNEKWLEGVERLERQADVLGQIRAEQEESLRKYDKNQDLPL
jgi:hypothetical protein